MKLEYLFNDIQSIVYKYLHRYKLEKVNKEYNVRCKPYFIDDKLYMCFYGDPANYIRANYRLCNRTYIYKIFILKFRGIKFKLPKNYKIY